jgi:hypothetical protein
LATAALPSLAGSTPAHLIAIHQSGASKKRGV